MAYQTIWYFTELPEDIVDTLDKDLYNNFDFKMEDSKLHGDALNKDIRKSKNAWISTNHWIAGFLWHYVCKANNDSGISVHFKPEFNVRGGQSINNKDAHSDYLNKQTEYVRKLSFTLQLSDPDDYEGGNVELIDEANQNYIAPRQRGTIILFDSRTQHRVNKVTKGTRRSIVGWVVGPRWK